MKNKYVKSLYIFLFCIFSFFGKGDMALNPCYGSFAPPVEIVQGRENVAAQKPKVQSKKAAKKAAKKAQKAKQKATKNTSALFLLNFIYAILTLFYWILMAISFVLWALLESNIIYISAYSWLILIGTFIYSGLVLLASIAARDFVKKARKEVREDTAMGYEGVYSQQIASSFLLLLAIGLMMAFPVSLFLINWSVSVEIVSAFAILLIGIILFFVGLKKGKKTQLEQAKPLENNPQFEEEYIPPTRENNKPLPQAQSEEYYIQD